MNYWWIIPIVLSLPLFYLFLVYLRNRFGFKDKNYGGIQRSPRLEPPKEPEAEFLPGSETRRSAELDDILDELEAEAKRTRLAMHSKPKRRIFLTHKEVVRSYIIDALLDKPKF
jgi:hypothetical protein